MLDGLLFVLESFYMKTIIILLMMVAGVWADDEDEFDVGDFAGAVLNKSAIVTGKNTAVTSDGKFISYNGKGFATSDGYYGVNKNQVFGTGKLIVKSKNLFYGSSLSWKNGNSYSGGNNVWITRKPKMVD
jgi:hypothetical protein